MRREDFVQLRREFGPGDEQKTLHCHSKDEAEEDCKVCRENERINVLEKFGLEDGIHHCHKGETEQGCEMCTVNARVERFDLLRKNGVFCYDWFDSEEQLNETKLPEQDLFFNKL